MRLFQVFILLLLVTLPFAAVAMAEDTVPPAVTPDAINAAALAGLPAELPSSPAGDATGSDAASPPAPDPAIVRLQILLDRAGASPGVIDGFDGDNVRKAVTAFEIMKGLTADGVIDPDMLASLDSPDPVIGTYSITAEDIAAIVPPLPTDYAELAALKFLGYTRITEALAERFHMDEDLLKALNPAASWAVGEPVAVAAWGPAKEGVVAARIEADKGDRQLRVYDASGVLLVAYPATIGSDSNPSPEGTHLVRVVAPMPNYTYNPDVNFQQGSNTEKLIIPPGPNGPVGSMWIDLTEPTFGIHGTPEPSKIDKTNSHGCVRLTNWDAEELAGLVVPGVPVEFID